MTCPDRNNPYTFDDFLDWRSRYDYYRDDESLQTEGLHFTADLWETVDQAARTISPKVSFRWRDKQVLKIPKRPDQWPFNDQS